MAKLSVYYTEKVQSILIKAIMKALLLQEILITKDMGKEVKKLTK